MTSLLFSGFWRIEVLSPGRGPGGAAALRPHGLPGLHHAAHRDGAAVGAPELSERRRTKKQEPHTEMCSFFLMICCKLFNALQCFPMPFRWFAPKSSDKHERKRMTKGAPRCHICRAPVEGLQIVYIWAKTALSRKRGAVRYAFDSNRF